MAERFQKIPGTQKISESYGIIDQNFEQLDNELSAIEQQIDALDTLSPADRAKLDGIEEGAQVNQNAFAKVNDLEASNPSDAVTITGGTGITTTTNPNTKEVIITATGEATPGPHGSSHLEFGSDPIPYATETTGGLMTAEDKQRLAELEGLPEQVRVEANTRGINVKYPPAPFVAAVMDGTSDDYAAVQAIMDNVGLNGGGKVFIPAGTLAHSEDFKFNYDNVRIEGAGRGATILKHIGLGSTFKNPDSDSVVRRMCGISSLKIESSVNDPSMPVLDLKSMQFTDVEKVWISGGGGNAVGINIEGIHGATDATYNHIVGCYIGNVGLGIRFGAIANACSVRDTRIQPQAGGWGVEVEDANNVFIHASIEFPGNVANGVKVGPGCNGVVLIANRFEKLDTAIEILAGAQNTRVIGSYYSSVTTKIIDSGTNTMRFDDNQIGIGSALFSLVNGDMALNTALTLGVEAEGDITSGGDKVVFNSTESAVQIRSFRSSPRFHLMRYFGGNWVKYFIVDENGKIVQPATGNIALGRAAGATEGVIWYDDADKKLKFHDGTAVRTVTSS